jgi:hypothetical protein
MPQPQSPYSAVPSNSSTKLQAINLCIVWGSAALPLMISFSASSSSGSGRRSAVITASLTIMCRPTGNGKCPRGWILKLTEFQPGSRVSFGGSGWRAPSNSEVAYRPDAGRRLRLPPRQPQLQATTL